MKRATAVFAISAFLALGGQAVAGPCILDAVPAATLLLPYFEVDFTTADDQKAITTVFSINNARATPALAHVTLWTNLSLPSINFDVYLTGYDVQVFNLRDMFRDGTLPITAHPDQDPDDTISPHGNNPTWDDADGAGLDPSDICDYTFPFRDPALNAFLIARIRNGHTGQPIYSDQCLGLDVGRTTSVDGQTVPLAIGYVTVDSANQCSVGWPGGPNYFVDGGLGIANNRNLLWGDYSIVDPLRNTAFSDTLVHIEADATVIGPNASTFSFYSGLDTGGADNREPLANAWATRYQTGSAFNDGTRLAVWRDPRVNTVTIDTVECGTVPFAALEAGQVVAFSEEEDTLELCEGVPPPPDSTCFPWAVNWTPVGGVLDPPFANGWLYLNLDLADLGTGDDFEDRSQAWVETVTTPTGLYQAGMPAVQMHSACDGLAPGVAGTVAGTVAEPCSIDAVPAATLLLPYFEVDFTTEDDQRAITTVFSINNARAAPALAHVTLWTNISLPTINFDVYLTGYDVQVVNLRSLFKDGTLPITAHPDQDPDDTISPHGNNPAWDDAGGAGLDPNDVCDDIFPFRDPALNASLIARIRNGHTGQPISGDQCLGLDVGKTATVDGVEVPLAIGHVTVDSVSRCSVGWPDGPDYFVDGGLGVANNRNLLWGDYSIVDPLRNTAFSDTLVHIEADATVIGPSVNTFSFYSRFDTDGADNREPLANAWAARYQTDGVFGGTQLAVWRDPRVDSSGILSVDCGTAPFTPNEEGQVVAFNEEEEALELCEQVSDDPCFPWAVNWVPVGTGVLDLPSDNGWLYLDLDLADLGTGHDPDDRSQAWVETVTTSTGLYQAGSPAVQLHSACGGLAPGVAGVIPIYSPLFADDFETGDTSAWSAAVGVPEP